MFDTNKVADNIKSARIKKNMTQMNLADEMGVSYQAVSNWERGNSMPDISKLPELCEILDISFEELVGEKTAQTAVAEKMMQDKNAEVSLEEIAQVGQLVQPEKIENKVNESIEKGEKISFSTLVGLAPFMDKESLGKIAEDLADVDLRQICALAPFLDRTTLDRIVERSIQTDKITRGGAAAVAPFLTKETVHKIAKYLIEHGRSGDVIAIAPFMGATSLSTPWGEIVINQGNDKEENHSAIHVEIDEMDMDEVAECASEALQKGNDITEYLDYMCEDDVEILAVKALETGKPIECYLDYMDEDAIKNLLLKVIKK